MNPDPKPFPKTWTADVLAAPPLIAPARQFIYPLRVPGEEDAMQRGALQLMVRPASGGSFLATCALGFRDKSVPTGVYSCPHADDMLAVAGGYAYLVDTLQPDRCVHLPLRPVTLIAAALKHRMLLLVGFHTIAAIDDAGLRWETAKLSWEGIKLGTIHDDQLYGEGWNMHTNREAPFTVDLFTGAHEGGGFTG